MRRRAEEGCKCFPANTRIATARGTTANGQVTATLDAAGRTTAISATAAGTTTYGYNRHDQPVTATLPGGLSGTMGYDQDTRLTSWSLVGPSTGVPTTTVNLQYGYGYDAANRTAGITVTDNSVSSVRPLTHDAEGRITSWRDRASTWLTPRWTGTLRW